MTLHAPVAGELKRMRARAGDVQVTFEVPPHRAADALRTARFREVAGYVRRL